MTDPYMTLAFFIGWIALSVLFAVVFAALNWNRR